MKTKKAIAEPRRFYGCELKPEYYAQALRNLASVDDQRKEEGKQLAMF
jgi:DNA modification methylase